MEFDKLTPEEQERTREFWRLTSSRANAKRADNADNSAEQAQELL